MTAVDELDGLIGRVEGIRSAVRAARDEMLGCWIRGDVDLHEALVDSTKIDREMRDALEQLAQAKRKQLGIEHEDEEG